MSADDNKGSIRYLFVFYSIPIRPNVKIVWNKGTKIARETSDIVRWQTSRIEKYPKK